MGIGRRVLTRVLLSLCVAVLCALPATAAAQSTYVRGDMNVDGSLSLPDAIDMLNYLFQSQPVPCVAAGDVDASDSVNLADPIILLQYLFLSGPAPVFPFPGCGTATTTLSCASHSYCDSMPPCNVAYADPAAVFIPGVPALPNVPSVECGAADTFSVTPALPLGLSIDSTTGVISGTPALESLENVYEVTAANQHGSTTVQITIRVSPRYYYTMQDQVVAYDQVTGQASFTLDLCLSEDSANPGFPTTLTGCSIGVQSDPNYLTVSAVTPTSVLSAMNGGNGPDYAGLTILPEGFTVGYVFSFTLLDSLELLAPQVVASVTLDTNAATLAGNAQGAVTPVVWSDTLGNPPVANIIVLQGVGAVPLLDDAVITLTPSP